jgi:hypothetical protein
LIGPGFSLFSQLLKSDAQPVTGKQLHPAPCDNVAMSSLRVPIGAPLREAVARLPPTPPSLISAKEKLPDYYADGPWEGPVSSAAACVVAGPVAPSRNGEVALRGGVGWVAQEPQSPLPSATSAAPSIEWLRAAVPDLEKRMIEEMTDEMIQSHPWRDRENTHPSLSNSVCTGATLRLQRMLGERTESLGLDLERRTTCEFMKSVGAMHVYLWAKNYYDPDQHLIIDPTIRQFFRDTLDAEQLATIPAIFIGSPQELEALFTDYFSPTPLARLRWVDKVEAPEELKTYLNTQMQSKDW